MKIFIGDKQVDLTTLGEDKVWIERGTTNVIGKAVDLRDAVTYDYSEERMALGRAIQEARKDKGYTMDELVAVACISKSALNAYEKGRISPTADALVKLEYFLDVRLLRM